MWRGLYLGFAPLLLSISVAAQEQPCEVGVPVNAIMPDAGLARGIPANGFVAKHGRDLLPIRSVSVDNGPRRIVLIADNGRNVNPAARKIEVSVLAAVVTKARREDTFGMLTTGGSRRSLALGEPRDALLSAISELSTKPEGKNQNYTALDAVPEAASWLQPSHPGDSIILLTMGLELEGNPGYAKMRESLTAGGIRLFGFQLGRIHLGTYSVTLSSTAFGFLVPRAIVDSDRETFFDLADETGGFFLGENTEGYPQQNYHLTDKELQLLDKLAGQFYKAIVEYYRIILPAAPKGYSIDLTDPLRKQLPQVHVIYQRENLRCSPSSTMNPPANPQK